MLLNRLEQHHISPQLVDHGIRWAAYFPDPDDNGIEVYVDRRKAVNGAPYWEGRSRKL
jgi:catechol-2,3-dioxygenase